MNQILYSKKTNSKAIIIILSVVLLILVLVFCFGFGIINNFNNKILRGVIASNVDLSNLTIEEAEEKINRQYRDNDVEKHIQLKYMNDRFEISTRDIGFSYTDADELAKQAYEYGRDGNILANNFTVLKSYFGTKKILKSEKKIDNVRLQRVVEEKAESGESFSKDDNYKISGDKLILTKGTESRKIDYELLSERVLEALKANETVVDIPVNVSIPEALNIDEIYSEIHISPVNASYSDTGEVVPERAGLDFDKEDAKKKYYSLKNGESVEIQLLVTQPEIKVENLGDVAFKNILASYTSKYDTNDVNKTTNIQTAAKKCNVILSAGEEFSFNNTIGGLTTENGYKNSQYYSDGNVVNSIGGGISQVSSTLYNAVLRANLLVTSRKASSSYNSYVEQSTDAYVDAKTDFKFKNDTKYPIRIITTCADGKCTVEIYSTNNTNATKVEIESKIIETKNYSRIEQKDSSMTSGTTKLIQSGVNGYTSEAYKVYYKDGKETKDLISKDEYKPVPEIVKVGTKTQNSPKPQPTKTQPTKPSVINNTPSNHNFVASNNWQNDVNSHWHSCSYNGCTMGHTSQKQAHTYTGWISSGPSTHYRTCTVCGRAEQGNHTFGNGTRGPVENSTKWVCTGCGFEKIEKYQDDPGVPPGWDNPISGY